MSDQNQPETPATPDQLQTPQWAQVSDATEAIPADLTAQQPEVVGSLSGEPTAEEASVSQAAPVIPPVPVQPAPVIPPVPVQPAAAAAALPAAPARARWSVKKGLLVGAAALGIATVGAAGGAAAVALTHHDGGTSTQQGQFGPGQGQLPGDIDGDGDQGGRGHGHGFPPGGMTQGHPNGGTGQFGPNGGSQSNSNGNTQQQGPSLPGTAG
jgi:hypothetical protein